MGHILREQGGRGLTRAYTRHYVARHAPKIPAWLLGLILAIVVFVVVILVFNALGYGDDPVVEGLSAAVGAAS